MDYDSHLRAMQQHPSLCNVVNFAAAATTTGDSTAAAATSSIMALMTDHHHHNQHNHHNLNNSENTNQPRHPPQQQDLRDVNHFSGSIINSAAAGANLSSTANYNPNYHHNPNSALEPYLQTALYQAQAQPPPHHHHHHHHSSYSSHGYSEEDTKPELVSTKQIPDYSNTNNNNNISNNNLSSGAGLLSPGAANSTCTQDNIAAAAARAGECIHHDNINNNDNRNISFADDHHHQHQQPDPIRAKIISHPIYPRLVLAYLNCNKIGAPPDISTKLDEVGKKYQNFRSPSPVSIGSDPDLDQFMETYCSVLQKYHEELTQPFKEAMAFFRKIELQLNALSKGSLRTSQPGVEGKAEAGNDHDNTTDAVNTNTNSNSNNNNNNMEMAASSDEEEGDGSCGEVDFHDDSMASSIDPLAEDQKLKEQLLRKYSGYICSLKQEFLKKKKKGKLPKEARQKLLDWWTLHYKWPYPSEAEKAALAESTGLDQKQINNWFINQRKRHWKPSEDMQYVMVDSPHHHHLSHVTAAHGIPPAGLASYHHMDAMDAAAAAGSIIPMHP